MAEWKKVVVSGSSAELSGLSLDTALTVANGGTGASTLTDGGILLGSGTGAITATSVLTNGQLLIGDGSGDPTLAELSTTTGANNTGSLKITNGPGSITLSVADQSIGLGNLSSSGTPAAGNVLKVATDGKHITFGSTSDGDLTEIIAPTNGGIEIGAGEGPIPSLTMSISDLAAQNTLAAADTFAFHDASSTDTVTTKKVTFTALSSSIIDTIAGDVNVDGAGVSTIEDDKITLAMIQDATTGSILATIAGDVDVTAGGVSSIGDDKITLAMVQDATTGSILATITGDVDVTAGGVSTIGANKVDGNKLTDDITIANDLTVTNNATVNGDLIVAGTASFNHSTNLSVADKYILLNSGSSAAGDGGIVIQQGTNGIGDLFGFDKDQVRFGMTSSFNADTSADFIPDAFVSAVIDSGIHGSTDPDTVNARYKKNGNIFVSEGTDDIYIYVEDA
jgi:hypothetical protein